jgi:hypothetical protein
VLGRIPWMAAKYTKKSFIVRVAHDQPRPEAEVASSDAVMMMSYQQPGGKLEKE